MIDTRFLKSFLRLNNVSDNASSAEIETVLTQAHWPSQQIEEALLAQSGDTVSFPTFVQEQRGQVFRPDMDWSSSKLSSLLGIDVIIDPRSFRATSSREEKIAATGKKILVGFCIATVAIAVAAGIGLGLMYFFQVGPFYTHVGDII